MKKLEIYKRLIREIDKVLDIEDVYIYGFSLPAFLTDPSDAPSTYGNTLKFLVEKLPNPSVAMRYRNLDRATANIYCTSHGRIGITIPVKLRRDLPNIKDFYFLSTSMYGGIVDTMGNEFASETVKWFYHGGEFYGTPSFIESWL